MVKKRHRECDVRFADLMLSAMNGTELHVKIGTSPASYARIVERTKPPKVGDRLRLTKSLGTGELLRVRCWKIKDLGKGDFLYYMELM